MLREAFLGRNPSHFHVNPIVKAYIVSESLLWAAWNFSTPIFAVFVVSNIAGGSIEVAATGYSVHLIARVLFELICGRYLMSTNDKKKFYVAIIGMCILSIGYLGFAVSGNVVQVFLFYIVLGAGLGIASPAKNTLFAMHLDKNKESSEWGIADGATFVAMALASALGGFIATAYGFPVLFVISSIVSILSVVPYILYLEKK